MVVSFAVIAVLMLMMPVVHQMPPRPDYYYRLIQHDNWYRSNYAAIQAIMLPLYFKYGALLMVCAVVLKALWDWAMEPSERQPSAEETRAVNQSFLKTPLLRKY